MNGVLRCSLRYSGAVYGFLLIPILLSINYLLQVLWVEIEILSKTWRSSFIRAIIVNSTPCILLEFLLVISNNLFPESLSHQKVLRVDIILTHYQPNLPSPWARKPVLWPRAMEDSAYIVLITMSALGTTCFHISPAWSRSTTCVTKPTLPAAAAATPSPSRTRAPTPRPSVGRAQRKVFLPPDCPEFHLPAAHGSLGAEGKGNRNWSCGTSCTLILTEITAHCGILGMG